MIGVCSGTKGHLAPSQVLHLPKSPWPQACLEGPLTQLSIAFAELLLWAQLWVKSGQVGTRHLGLRSMLTAPYLVKHVGVCFLQGRHPGISFLQCVQPHTPKTPYPCAVYLFVYSTNIYQLDVPGTVGCQGMKLCRHQVQSMCSWSPVKQKSSRCCFLFFFFVFFFFKGSSF